jgi:hypothetical protein
MGTIPLLCPCESCNKKPFPNQRDANVPYSMLHGILSPVMTHAQSVIHVEMDKCYHCAEVGNNEEGEKSCSWWMWVNLLCSMFL